MRVTPAGSPPEKAPGSSLVSAINTEVPGSVIEPGRSPGGILWSRLHPIEAYKRI